MPCTPFPGEETGPERGSHWLEVTQLRSWDSDPGRLAAESA